jgi:trans-L-3-hydroxyproline dehydratase
VELTNVPSYATHLDASLEVEGLGTLSVDVAFGGMWYAIADAAALGFELVPDEARDLCIAGEAVRLAAREQLSGDVSIVQLAEPWRGVGAVSRNAVVIAPGRLDRSATGTGLSARMATLHARGLMRVGESMTHASVIGSTFDGRIVSEAEEGIVPAIRGSAFITGRSELYVDERDPYPEGYLLNDTWPGDDVQH